MIKLQQFMTLLNKSIGILILSAVFIGCGEKDKKSSYIFILDLTQSVPEESKNKAFEAIRKQAQKLNRGDSITVIPLTGDAITESGGRVLRLEVSEKREAFDADLRKFAAEAERKFEEMQTGAASKTYKQTDLFGALRIAREEMSLTDKEKRRTFLIILSDLVQSTKDVRFDKDAAFQSTETAKKYAEKLVPARDAQWADADVYVGLMESSDLQQMNGERREAVRVFWQEFFRLNGVNRFQCATDGIGQLAKFIEFKSKNG